MAQVHLIGFRSDRPKGGLIPKLRSHDLCYP